jgi:pilin isopeptide linkage protein/LPXTG-motif cell wall-anchored protein
VAVQAVTNQGSAVTFDPILCNKIGSTTYTMREVAGNNKKIIYDKTEYTVLVDVVKDENGDYVGTVTYMNGETVLLETPAFANKTKPIVPNTGDNANIALWGGMMVVALAAIVVLLVVMKKKSAKQ